MRNAGRFGKTAPWRVMWAKPNVVDEVGIQVMPQIGFAAAYRLPDGSWSARVRPLLNRRARRTRAHARTLLMEIETRAYLGINTVLRMGGVGHSLNSPTIHD